jgi:hypothetical protein
MTIECCSLAARESIAFRTRPEGEVPVRSHWEEIALSLEDCRILHRQIENGQTRLLRKLAI